MSLHESRAGSAANQLELWTAPGEESLAGLRVIRRDGRESSFDLTVLSNSILRAGWPGEALDADTVASLSQAVLLYLQHSTTQPVSVATLRETVERLLIDMGYTLTARMYAGAFAPSPAADANSGMFDESLPVDRAERLLAAAAADAGLDCGVAEDVVAQILRQISAAEIQHLSPGLLREWMRSELRTRGLSSEALKLARISMPISALHDAFAESEDAPVISPADPEAAALALASRVSAAYVLGQLIPAAVGQAHVRGDIQIRGAGNFLRLDSIAMDLEGLKEHGPIGPGAPYASADEPEALASHISIQSGIFARFFGGEVSWSAINFGFAPYLSGRTNEEVDALAREVISEIFIRAHASGTRGGFSELRFAWDAPDDFPAELIGPGGARMPLAEAYPDARRFLGAALAALMELSEAGHAAPALRVAIHLSPYFFGAPDADLLLERIGRIAAGAMPVTLRHAAAAPLMFDDAGAHRPAEIVAQTVSVSAVRAAKLSANLDTFLSRLDAAVDNAVAAHRAKREFVDRVLHQRSGPLTLLQRNHAGQQFAALDTLRYHIAVTGLTRAALARAGIRWMSSGEELVVAQAALDRVGQSCTRWTTGTGQHFVLTGAHTARNAEAFIHRTATRLAETVALEGELHPLYDLAPPVAVSGDAFARPADITEFIRHAFLHTSCRALHFS